MIKGKKKFWLCDEVRKNSYCRYYKYRKKVYCKDCLYHTWNDCGAWDAFKEDIPMTLDKNKNHDCYYYREGSNGTRELTALWKFIKKKVKLKLK